MKIEEGHLKGLRRGIRSGDRCNQDREYTHMKLKKIKKIYLKSMQQMIPIYKNSRIVPHFDNTYLWSI